MKKPALLIALILTIASFCIAQDAGPLTKLTKEDMELLLEDQGPSMLKRLSEDAELRKTYIKSIREFLAIASQARKDGFADSPEVKNELAFIAQSALARDYDSYKNKGKAAQPPFSLITDAQVTEYYRDPKNETEFQEYVKEKIAIAKRDGRFPPDKELSKEDTNVIKDSYARIRIYAKEAEGQKAALGKDFERKAELNTKLQQSQYLVQIYTQKVLNLNVKVTDQEIAEYIAAHPELSPKAKKAKAMGILRRIKAGANFAALAERVSDDPGTKGKGGLYQNVTKGLMVSEFEQAALALKPGQVSSRLVETKYGYHIIKLEKKGKSTDANGNRIETYDVRHILVSTMVKDEANLNPAGTPVTDYVSSKIDGAKQQKAIDEIMANNPVEVAEDFVIKVPPGATEVKEPQEVPPALKPEGEGKAVTEVTPAPVRKKAPAKKRKPR